MSWASLRHFVTFAVVGSLFFVINGMFSIRGAGAVLPPLGGEALAFWHIITSVVVEIAGVPVPVIAWLFVLVCSVNEAHAIRALFYEHRAPRAFEFVLFVLLGGYDFWTTQAGFAATWFASLHGALQTLVTLLFALVFTFGTEALYCQLRRNAYGRKRGTDPVPSGDTRARRVTHRPLGRVAASRASARPDDDGDLF